MAVDRVGDMTLDELHQLIEEIVEQRLGLQTPDDTRTIDEINDSIRRHRWTPPPGAKSSLELLREDRDA